ncbi:NAD-dependent epimerase/dehydratase family protein [Alkalicoccus daliensis]|uniref:Nucleoside-diphosphate-sugar epimerase n=1 Tax=Alkalicoccus daliensis TaxID=745820 RepID=A0A1H0ICH5_9BACI|nr:NAD-dependent epimerase/dehydratase family protein [Alkalicoccus daliensis]SDO29092.1 Nucleoside-diphosphate-sugar epimerase [Alkalicoccus daliensis]
MHNVLILGGTRFFGKRLVKKLEEKGIEVTIATRGEKDISFSKKAKHVKVDRFNRKSMEEAFQDTVWDAVYDQICFSPDDAQDAVDIFQGKTKKYIFTSTLSVYDMNDKGEKVESDFNPYSYQLKKGRKEKFEYGEGKRLAEAVFFQKADFPVTAVRPPIVLGEDDYTERLHDHIRRVINQEKIGIDNLEAKLSFVDSDDLADFLMWAGEKDVTGPVNASSPDQLTLAEFIKEVEKAVEKKAVITSSTEGKASPMNFPVSFYQSVQKAEEWGYQFKSLSDWFPPLVRLLAEKEIQ